ncbi:hypothetical protein QTN47_26790 [Danxiaibacter flavus]|uniref:Outer membrane protein n=1 Tax=Danxiaibacter flavus TaxID=3049108 RepID=A0ABV3ZNH8_9BACT|nr:hypothetical protein QNM32_26790 [Chitinophagaceae bacterium DXS]
MQLKYSLFAFSFLMVACGSLQAQNNASPYSIAGIGDIEQSYFDRSSGIANTGVALSSNKYQYAANPASLVKLDDFFFDLELSGRYRNVSYSGQPIGQLDTHSNDFQVKRLALAFKMKSWWGIGFGLAPFSSANYSFTAPKEIQGSNDYTSAHYEGTGGVNKVYLSNSFGFGKRKNLRIGLETSYLFGSLEQKETITYSNIVTNNQIHLDHIYFKGGIQYSANIAKKWGIAVGASAANKTQLAVSQALTVSEANVIINQNDDFKNSYFNLPVIYTVGGAITYNKTFTVAADYQKQNWNDVNNLGGLGYILTDANRISGGIEYVKNLNYRSVYLEKWYLQAGAFHTNTYVKLSGQQIDQTGFTLGGGISSLKIPFAVQANVEFGQRGTTNKGLIKENYQQFNITLFYRDFWFTKQKKYD